MLTKKQLLIVEKNNELRPRLHRYFSDHHYSVTSTPNKKTIKQILLKKTIHLIVLSLTSTSSHVYCLLEWLTHHYPQIHLIMTVNGQWANIDERAQLLEKGATDIVIKPFQNKELLLRINNVFPFIAESPNDYQTGDLTLHTANHCIFKAEKRIPLTPLETKMLKLLYLHIDNVVTRDFIAQQLYGTEHHPLDRSIDIHINKIRKKIENNPAQPTYIRTVRGKGYYLKSSSLPYLQENKERSRKAGGGLSDIA